MHPRIHSCHITRFPITHLIQPLELLPPSNLQRHTAEGIKPYVQVRVGLPQSRGMHFQELGHDAHPVTSPSELFETLLLSQEGKLRLEGVEMLTEKFYGGLGVGIGKLELADLDGYQICILPFLLERGTSSRVTYGEP